MRWDKSMLFGVFFLLLGLSILLKIFLKIDFPVFKAAFAIFLLYAGTRMLLGSFGLQQGGHPGHKDRTRVVLFSKGTMGADGGDTREGDAPVYNVVFGSATIDLTSLRPPADGARDVHVEVNTVFGEAIVLVDPAQPLVLRANAAFAEARLPNDDMVAFGTLTYRTPAAKEAGRAITIHGNSVFGSLKFVAPVSRSTGKAE